MDFPFNTGKNLTIFFYDSFPFGKIKMFTKNIKLYLSKKTI